MRLATAALLNVATGDGSRFGRAGHPEVLVRAIVAVRSVDRSMGLLPKDQFRRGRAALRRSAERDADRVTAELEAIATTQPGQQLVICCFKDVARRDVSSTVAG